MALNFRSLVSTFQKSLRILDRIRRDASAAPVSRAASPARTTAGPGQPAQQSPSPGAGTVSGYPGDFHGAVAISYAPQPDGAPDPGEVVWTWVPYEEDHSRGKDRPVLLVGHNGRYLLGLMLTSRDHDQDAHAGNDYVDIGSGSWDRQSRPSEAKIDRILQISPETIRREGAVLDRRRFELVAAGLRRRHGWN
ncbi:MAG TPA: type II toxin-antitoxin system PemK/MazF family toxin [Arthrobacter sp.]|nr:type II toxin-antitoxin system PemK/MazF family toxin [Arthrobacter sp.]